MKAWIVREKDEFEAAVVFAETRGQAKMMALHTDACEDSDFLSIEARRIKAADQYYKPGKRELDWFNSEDRIAMVKDCGFTCIPEARSVKECVICPAKDFCDDYIFEEEGDGCYDCQYCRRDRYIKGLWPCAKFTNDEVPEKFTCFRKREKKPSCSDCGYWERGGDYRCFCPGSSFEGKSTSAENYCRFYLFSEEGVLGGRDGSRKNEYVLQRLLLSGDSGVREYSLLRIHPENRDAEAVSGGGRVYGEGVEEG